MNTVFEALIYNREMDKNETANIYSYLQSKYGFQLQTYTTPESIAGLTFWYDPNDLSPESLNLFAGHGGTGPTLSNRLTEPNLLTYRGNQYIEIKNDDEPYLSDFTIDLSGHNEFTLFTISYDMAAVISSLFSLYSEGGGPDSDLMPNLIYDGDNLIQICNSRSLNINVLSSSSSDISNGSIDFTRNILVTCTTYNYTSGITTVQTKGTFGELIDTTIRDVTFAPDSYRLILGAGDFDASGNIFIDRIEGYLGETLFYTRALNDIEKLNMFNYLETKWVNGNGPFSTNPPPPIS
jgi:hypothetical protein